MTKIIFRDEQTAILDIDNTRYVIDLIKVKIGKENLGYKFENGMGNHYACSQEEYESIVKPILFPQERIKSIEFTKTAKTSKIESILTIHFEDFFYQLRFQEKELLKDVAVKVHALHKAMVKDIAKELKGE